MGTNCCRSPETEGKVIRSAAVSGLDGSTGERISTNSRITGTWRQPRTMTCPFVVRVLSGAGFAVVGRRTTGGIQGPENMLEEPIA